MSKDEADMSDDGRFMVAEAAEAEEGAMIEAGNQIMLEEMEEEEEDADCPEEEEEEEVGTAEPKQAKLDPQR